MEIHYVKLTHYSEFVTGKSSTKTHRNFTTNGAFNVRQLKKLLTHITTRLERDNLARYGGEGGSLGNRRGWISISLTQ